ncbi:hypothetical protein ACFVVU_09025 [Kitasatospora sp. NPDC057965]|uniref:hypothetical protein n=1 Tax=Kitasatospora sp. NPDC057965 TaxID=3346291 RepID=UPI0036DD578A
MWLAATLTPQGMPVGSFLILLAVLGACVWNALRMTGEPWFRWLLPSGCIVFILAIATGFVPLIFVASGLAVAGYGLTKRWRWNRR